MSIEEMKDTRIQSGGGADYAQIRFCSMCGHQTIHIVIPADNMICSTCGLKQDLCDHLWECQPGHPEQIKCGNCGTPFTIKHLKQLRNE